MVSGKIFFKDFPMNQWYWAQWRGKFGPMGSSFEQRWSRTKMGCYMLNIKDLGLMVS